MDDLPVPVYRTSPDGRVLFANHALAEVLGYESPEALRAVAVADLYADPSERSRVLAMLNEAGAFREYQCLLRRADGQTMWASASATAIRDPRGRPVEYQGVLWDITRWKVMEKTAHDRIEQYRNVFVHAPVAMWEEDLSEVQAWFRELRGSGITNLSEYLDRNPDEIDRVLGLIRVTDVNVAARELIGMASPAELIQPGSALGDLSRSQRLALRAQLLALWDGRSEIDVDVIIEGPGRAGEYLVRAVAPSPAQEDPDFGRMVVSVVDLTQNKEASIYLEELLKSKEEFLQVITHEVRTPLAAVVGFSQRLDDSWNEFEAEERHDLVALVAEQSRELAHLLDDMIVVMRLRDGRISVVPEGVDLSQVVGRVLMGFTREYGRPIELRGRAYAWADPMRVRQIVRNLVGNALRHGGDSVRVELTRDEQGSHVLVYDDGPGIGDGTIIDVFQPFPWFATPSTSPGTLGLGLAVCRTLARLMGGEVIYRRRSGETVFDLTLPTQAPV
jgi:PAS domain S-box-containing protein